MASQRWLNTFVPLNNGIGFTGKALEFFLYNLRGDDSGVFLMGKCGNASYKDICEGGDTGRCVHGFINTPEHTFSLVCRTLGLY